MTYEEVRKKLPKEASPVLDMIIVSAMGKKKLYSTDVDKIATMYYNKLKEQGDV